MDVRALVIDDEPLARLGVTTRLESFSDICVVGECTNADEALASISRLSPDVIFLDVEMPGLSGMELLSRLSYTRPLCIVFLTAHEEYALQAFSVEALDYLLKPIDDARFAVCIERVRRAVHLHEHDARLERLQELLAPSGNLNKVAAVKRFPIRRGNDFIFVPIGDVDWIEGLGDYAGLHVGGKTHLIREALTSLEGRLDRDQFVRIHRSTIVQVERILRVEPTANRDALLTLRDGKTLRVSRTHRARLDALLMGP